MEDMTDKILIPRDKPSHECRCIRCNRVVEPADDVAILKFLLHRKLQPERALRYLMEFNQHLFPVYEGELRVCIGSPSNLQYLEGQPRDTRGLVDYIPRFQPVIRAAYEELKRVEIVRSDVDVHPTAKGVM